MIYRPVGINMIYRLVGINMIYRPVGINMIYRPVGINMIDLNIENTFHRGISRSSSVLSPAARAKLPNISLTLSSLTKHAQFTPLLRIFGLQKPNSLTHYHEHTYVYN
jgi:hypothetical protein